MAAIPAEINQSPVAAAIYAKHKSVQEGPRRYLGASAIGKECDRALWYEFRWCGSEDFDGRMLRLFDTGHREEARLIEELRGIGCEVWDRDQAGEQIGIVAMGGHFRGHLDGVVLNVPDAPKTPHVLETKTSSKKLYELVAEHGVEKAKQTHWAQMQVYMHFMSLDRALYMVVCKDDDRIYTERVRYDKEAALQIVARAKRIIEAQRPPEGISKDRDHYGCRYCPHLERCHSPISPTPAVPVAVTCRSCIHSTPVINDANLGTWRCERHDRSLDESAQVKACEDHLFIPDLVTFATYQDSGDSPEGGWVEYKNATGQTWVNTKIQGGYRSVELTILPHPLVGAGKEEISVDAVKQELGGTVEEIAK